ncbi:MAG: CCA tRNA nucleotidyltransferase, partial [Actinomycetes bacterium]
MVTAGALPPRFAQMVEAVAPIAEAFERAGRSLYFVGGSVRDAFLDASTESPDYDLTTDALPDEIESLCAPFATALWTQGKRFGTIGFIHGGQQFEITTHRAEVYLPESRKPEVSFGDDIDLDLSRRDFTVNAMALRIHDLTLIDPYGGISDLLGHRLRTPLDPQVSFEDDPLRMLRAARFAAKYSLEPDAELLAAVTRNADRLSIVSAERIRDELDKIMVLDVPSHALW